MAPRNLNPAALSEEQITQLKSNIDQLARAADSATIELCTEEQLNSLSAAVCISGMPPLKDVMGPAMQLSRITDQVKAESRVRAQRQQAGALFTPAPGVPVIDGNADEFWKASTAYRLENVVDETRASSREFSG